MKRGTRNQSNPETHYMDCEAGRRLAWSEFGDLRGRVVLYFHGFPGSRLEVSLIQHVAARLCIRLVVPDRPGIGASDYQPARHIQDWPADVEALADKLRLERFHLLGVSGGGPYALATALAIPQRLYGVSIVSGVGETTSSGALDGMNPLATRFIRFNQRMPGVARWTLTHLLGPLLKAAPALVLKILAGSAPEADMKVLNQPAVRGITLMSVREAMRQGPKGVVQELALISRPWGFDPGNIRVPLQLWHGEADVTVPVSMGRRHAQQIPGCDAYFLPGEGHFSVLIGYIQDILKLLLKVG